MERVGRYSASRNMDGVVQPAFSLHVHHKNVAMAAPMVERNCGVEESKVPDRHAPEMGGCRGRISDFICILPVEFEREISLTSWE